jgi:hypothetical protein
LTLIIYSSVGSGDNAPADAVEDGPARNRTANPLIKSSLGDTTTADHGVPPPAISEEYES